MNIWGLDKRPRETLATAALLVAILALLIALAGGSYAAGRYLGTAASKSRPQVRWGPRGPRGPRGEAGRAGPAGPAGANGENGASGSSVTATELKPGNVNCAEGGTEIKTAGGTVFACNGDTGPEGRMGPPGPAITVLPQGKTETGVWTFGPLVQETMSIQINFTIPLPSVVTAEGAIEYCGQKEAGLRKGCEEKNAKLEEHCPGSLQDPKAAVGYLCVYVDGGLGPKSEVISVQNPEEGGEPGKAGRSSAELNISPVEGSGQGTWAVTAS
jgi:hypothetical protein